MKGSPLSQKLRGISLPTICQRVVAEMGLITPSEDTAAIIAAAAVVAQYRTKATMAPQEEVDRAYVWIKALHTCASLHTDTCVPCLVL